MLEQPRLAEVARDVVLLGVAHAAVGLQRAVGGLEAGVGAQVLGRVGLAGAGLAVVVEPGGLAQHQLGGVEPGQRVGERELESLVHADRAAEHLALVAVAHGAAQRRAAEAERLGGDQHALGVQAVEDVAEALALLADAVLDGDRAGRR